MSVVKQANQDPPKGATEDQKTRKGGWITTYTGRPFWPCDPRVEDIHLEDIAHALSNQCRFSGHVKSHYSVAEHSVRVARHVWRLRTATIDNGELHAVAMLSLWGLLHDAPEAYLVDLPRPLKHTPGFGDGYKESEALLMAAVCDKFGLPYEEPAEVKQADLILLETERRDLLVGSDLWSMGVEPLSYPIIPWGPVEAKRAFLYQFDFFMGLLGGTG